MDEFGFDVPGDGVETVQPRAPLTADQAPTLTESPQPVATQPRANDAPEFEHSDARLHPVKTRIRTHRSVRKALAVAQDAQKTFQDRMAELEPVLYPKSAIPILQKIIAESHDVQLINSANDKLMRLRSMTTADERASKSRGTTLANHAKAEFVKTIPPLLDAADEVLSGLIAEAVASETALFRQFGLQREETSVSKRLNAVKATLAHFRKSLNPDRASNQPEFVPHSNNFKEVLEWFAA